ncbi:hypothetical protein REPUB_Repub05bG0021300 [Reevesia pubescens]
MMSGGRPQLLLLLFIALFYLLLLQEISAKAEPIKCKESERQALLEFKQSLKPIIQPDDYSILSSWYTEDCCEWMGVECNFRTGYVEKLDLSDSSGHLEGTIGPSLLKLQHLNYLDLRGNDFNGSHIPEFIGSLKNLRYLDLSFSNFSGPIPSQLGNLSMLEALYLDKQVYFDFGSRNIIFSPGNLEWLSHLSSLKDLDLSFANLSKASDWSKVVNQLPFLKTLVLRDCDLPSVSSSYLSFINSSTSLTILDLSGNNLSSSSIYPWLFNVSSNLTTLDLSRNQLKGPIPESFGNMVALTDLSLSNNQLEGGIYRSFWNMCSLRFLDMESNHLSAFGFVQNTSLCKAYSLEELRLADNQLKGSSVLNEITKLSSLAELDLGYNLLNGTISQSIGQLSNLVFLRLAGNSFDNVVISEAHFANLTNLEWLDLSYTSLTLKFNSSWIPRFQPLSVWLCSCKLGPHFPKWLRKTQASLEFLDISATEISGSLPNRVWDTFFHIFYLNLSFNQINGTLPNNSIPVVHLDLSSNNLSGPLTQVLTDAMESLNLSKNKLYGLISSICNITARHLRFLDLSSNLLSGVLPDCFAQFPNLTVLNLADNNFSGPIPSSLGSLASLEMLNLRGNRFSGRLPPSLQNCMHLKFVDLSDNMLFGNIPVWIGQSLSSLVFLGLQANLFNGKIPHQLCGLKYIQILDLSINKISGNIPRCLNNFTSMTQKVKLDQKIEHLLLDLEKRYEIRGSIHINYIDEALLMWRGTKRTYEKILGLLLAIDLSFNQLTGEIPEELTNLQELVALNLSKNFLTGKIPRKIGQLRQLQSLDLSRNKLSGNIPQSLSEITFLGSLDLSYNYLSGKIPTGSQLQLFDPSIFSHNQGLCGPPVTPNCSILPQGQPKRGEEDFDEFRKWFYAGMGLGFAVGFWGFCGAVFFKRSWRHSYFRLLDNVKNWIYVSFVVQKARLKRRIKT